MKKVLFVATAFAAFSSAFAVATIEGKIVRQQWPWNGKVNIDYILRDASGGVHDIGVVLKRGDTVIEANWGSLEGDLYGVGPGEHRIVWSPSVGIETPTADVWDDFRVELSILDADDAFMIVDTPEGAPDRLSVTFTNAPPSGGWNTVEYKTSKMVLRRIPAGTFMMGSPTDELGRNGNLETQHKVTLTKPFYIGIFPMTQKQYKNITGRTDYAPSNSGDYKPAHTLAYQYLRGTNSWTTAWPNCEPTSFLGQLSAKVSLPASLAGYSFDLPTDAQWEYACRAGTTGAWNNGTTITNTTTDANLNLLGRYKGSSGYMVVDVGLRLPNAYGLYDMHGNCADVVRDKAYGQGGRKWFDGSPMTDPLLAGDSWPYVFGRAGYWNDNASACRAAARFTVGTISSAGNGCSPRLVLSFHED